MFDKIKKDVLDTKQKWDTYFSFNKDIEKLKKEEWLGIRHKAFGILQDFTINWQENIKKKKKDFIYFYVNNLIELYKESLGVYRFLIGDNFERDHWKNLFMLLKFDNSLTKDNLIFGNFLEKTEFLVKKSSEIKELYTRAQGEILIRNAISELTVWFESAEFLFTEYVNNNRK